MRLRAIIGICDRRIGIGPITADAAVATVGNAPEFKHGRQMAAWLGLAPTQHSSGGRAELLNRCIAEGTKYRRHARLVPRTLRLEPLKNILLNAQRNSSLGWLWREPATDDATYSVTQGCLRVLRSCSANSASPEPRPISLGLH